MPEILTPLASVNDLKEVFELDIPDALEPRAQALLDRAEARLKRLRPGLADNVASGAVDEVLVRGAIVDAVLRVLRNPQGYASEQVGDLSYRLSAAASSGLLDFTARELADCTPVGSASDPARAVGVGSIGISVPSYRRPGGDVWH